MKSVIILSSILLVFTACKKAPRQSESVPPFPGTSTSPLPSIAEVDSVDVSVALTPSPALIAHLDAVTSDIAVDSIYLGYTPPDGRPIDTSFLAYFGKLYESLLWRGPEPRLFAVARFAIDIDHRAYILRVPAEYVSSTLDLWIYNIPSGRFETPITLVSSLGEEGEWIGQASWILDIDGDKRLDLVLRNTNIETNPETGDVLFRSDTVRVLRRTDSTYVPWVGRKYGDLLEQFTSTEANGYW